MTSAGLAGCQLVRPNIPEYTPSPLETCVGAHEWTLDVATLATSTRDSMAEVALAVSVAVEGTQTLTYTPGVGSVVVDSDLTITASARHSDEVAVRTVDGESTGRAYFSDDVAIPRDWDESRLDIVDSFTKGGTPVDPAPWRVTHSWIDDTVGLETTCTDDTLTLVARGTKNVWTFHSPGWTPAPTDSATPAPQ